MRAITRTISQHKAKALHSRALLKAVLLAAFALGGQQVVSSAYLLAKAELAQYLIARAWRNSHNGAVPVRPWPWADTHPVARLHVPRLNIARYLLADASERTLAFGAGHVNGSGRPGDNISTVFAGHRDSHFAFLQHLQAGDLIQLETDRIHRYRVVDLRVIDSRTHSIPVRRHNELLLATCYPFENWQSGGPLRYLVTTEKINEPQNITDKHKID